MNFRPARGAGVVFGLMRFALLTVVLIGACDGGGKTAPDAKPMSDAQVVVVDAAVIDAVAIDAPMIDAMVDAGPPSMEVMTACMHACDAISICEGGAPSTTCYSACGADLGDCTMQQLMDVDACSQIACPSIVMCLEAITCVDG